MESKLCPKKGMTLNFFMLTFFFVAGIFLLSFQPVLAEGIVPCGGPSDPCTLCHFLIGIQNLFTFGIKIITAVSLAAIFFAGFMYVISSGNQDMMTSAKSFLSSSLIGFTIVMGAWLIVNVTLWALATKTSTDPGGGLGIGKTNWYTFSCSTSTASTTAAPASSGATPATPVAGTAGTACGNNNLGICTKASTNSNANAFTVCSSLGKTWLSGGTDCNSGIYCCADKIAIGGSCNAIGGAGTCQRLGAGGNCPSGTYKQNQPDTERWCADNLGCCLSQNIPLPGAGNTSVLLTP